MSLIYINRCYFYLTIAKLSSLGMCFVFHKWVIIYIYHICSNMILDFVVLRNLEKKKLFKLNLDFVSVGLTTLV